MKHLRTCRSTNSWPFDWCIHSRLICAWSRLLRRDWNIFKGSLMMLSNGERYELFTFPFYTALPFPPNLGLSEHGLHFPQSFAVQPLQSPHHLRLSTAMNYNYKLRPCGFLHFLELESSASLLGTKASCLIVKQYTMTHTWHVTKCSGLPLLCQQK